MFSFKVSRRKRGGILNRLRAVETYIVLTKLIISKNLPMSYNYDKDLSTTQLHTLVKLDECGDLNLSRLAEEGMVTNQAMTQIADKLEKLGYVERCYSKENRRVTNLHLTENGQGYIKRFYEKMDQMFLDMFSSCSDEEIGKLEEASRFIVSLLAKVVEDYGEKYKCELKQVLERVE